MTRAFSFVFLVALPLAAQQPPQPNPNPQGLSPPELVAPPANQLPRIVQVPLLDCSGLPCVELTTGDGTTLRVLIDLGERNAFLGTKAAQKLGLASQPLKNDGGADISQVRQTIVPGAKLGDLLLGDFPFMVVDNTPDKTSLKSGQESQPLPGDGALTYGAFQNRLVQLDLANHALRVSEPLGARASCPRNCSTLAIKHFGQFGPVTITGDGFTLNGQPVDAQIDTLFPGSALIYPASVDKLGLKKEKKGKGKQFFPFTQSGIELTESDPTAALAFRGTPLLNNAPLYFPTKDEAFPAMRFDATLGLAAFANVVVTFDFKGNQIWIGPAGSGGSVQ